MGKCALCGSKITKDNNGLMDFLDNGERKRFLKIGKNQTICMECKQTLMYVTILSPF